MLPSLVDGDQGSMDRMVGEVRSNWDSEPRSKEEKAREVELGGKRSRPRMPSVKGMKMIEKVIEASVLFPMGGDL